jgi:predicted permease
MLLDNFIFSVNSVAPVFLLLLLGFLIARKGVLDRPTIGKLNWMVFNMALPVMLCRDIAESEFSEMFDRNLIFFAVGASIFTCLLSTLLSRGIKERTSRGAFIQGCFRGNYAIVGLPIAANILGPNNTGKAALITTFIIPLYNVLAILVLQAYGNGKTKATVKSAAIGIATNPLIIGILIGLAASAAKLRPPQFVSQTMDYLGGLASPLALLAIGASIDGGETRRKLKPALLASAFKLALVPILLVPLAALLGFRGESMVVLYVMLAAPTAVSSYIMAENMGSDGALAANIVMMTMSASTLTFTLGIFLVKTAGLF